MGRPDTAGPGAVRIGRQCGLKAGAASDVACSFPRLHRRLIPAETFAESGIDEFVEAPLGQNGCAVDQRSSHCRRGDAFVLPPVSIVDGGVVHDCALESTAAIARHRDVRDRGRCDQAAQRGRTDVRRHGPIGACQHGHPLVLPPRAFGPGDPIHPPGRGRSQRPSPKPDLDVLGRHPPIPQLAVRHRPGLHLRDVRQTIVFRPRHGASMSTAPDARIRISERQPQRPVPQRHRWRARPYRGL